MAKYGGYQMRVIGTDQTKKNVTLPGAQLVDADPSRSQGYMQQAAQSLGGAAATISEGTKLAAGISSDLTKNAIDSNNAQVAVAQTQAQTAGIRTENSARFYGQLSSTLNEYAEREARAKAAKEEAAYKQARDAIEDQERARKMAIEAQQEYRAQSNFEQGNADAADKKYLEQRNKEKVEYEVSTALPDYTLLESEATNLMYSYGADQVQSRLNALNEKHRGKVTPEFTVEFTKRIQDLIKDETVRQQGAKYKGAEVLQDNARSIHKQTVELTALSTASMMANGVITVEEGIQQIDSLTRDYIDRNQLAPTDALVVRNAALKQMLDSGKLGLDQKNKVYTELANIDKATVELNQLLSEEKLSPIGENERKQRIFQIATRYNIDFGKLSEIADPLADLRANAQQAELSGQYTDLERTGIIKQINLQQFSEANVGDAVGKLISQGDAAAQAALAENNPETKGIQFWEHARQVYKQYTTYKTNEVETKQKISALQVTQAKLRVEYEKLKSGGATESTIMQALSSIAAQNAQALPEEMRPAMEAAASKALDPALISEMYQNINVVYSGQIAELQNNLNKERGELARYGLDNLNPPKGQPSSLQLMRAAQKARIEGYNKALQNLPAAQGLGRGATSPFNSGTGGRLRPVPSRNGVTQTIDGVTHKPIIATGDIKKVVFGDRTFAAPFKPNQGVVVSSDYGVSPDSPTYKRRGRAHAGIDLAVPEGTEIISPTAGRVVAIKHQVGAGGKGYGTYIDVEIPDGRVIRYAHLAGHNVSVGMEVRPGQSIARAGQSGAPGQPHLHMEVRTRLDSYGSENTQDPKAFLEEIAQGYTPRAPRRNNEMGTYYNPYGSNMTTNQQRTPRNAIKLPNGQYISANTIYGGDVPKAASAVYNRANPMKDSVVPSSTHGLNIAALNQRGNSYNYEKLARNPDFADAITETATWLGVPGVWLADVLHFESALNPQLVNRQGYVGLAQFGKEWLSEVGLTTEKVRTMNYKQQLDLFKEYVNTWGLRGQITNMAELYMLFQRPAHVKRYRNGEKNLINQRDGNGGSVREYIQKNIGREVGRKYTVSSSDARRSGLNMTHDKYIQSCAVCSQLAYSGSQIIPHTYDG